MSDEPSGDLIYTDGGTAARYRRMEQNDSLHSRGLVPTASKVLRHRETLHRFSQLAERMRSVSNCVHHANSIWERKMRIPEVVFLPR